MYSKIKKLFLLIFSIGIGVFCCLQAQAYLLSGAQVLALMAESIGTPKRLKVEQKLVIYGTAPANAKGQVEIDETISYLFPENFRSDIHYEDTQKTHIFSKGESVTLLNKEITSTVENSFDFYKDILLYRSGVLLEERITLLGVDSAVTSLGRFQDKIVYIVGAKYPDESVSQLWIDKEALLPLRWLIVNRNENSLHSIEFRYADWRKVDDIFYPMMIEFYQDKALVRRVQAEKINPEPVFPAKFFDVANLKSLYPPAIPDLQENQKPNDLDEIKKTIDDFNQIFEPSDSVNP